MSEETRVLVVGSIGLDTVEAGGSKAEEVLGGSAVYFSAAASLFTAVDLVSVVGTDFPEQHRLWLESREIDLAGLEVADGKTFRWHGRYSEDMNERDTIEVRLNVFGGFVPKVPESYRNDRFVFLANGSPVTQLAVLDSIESPYFVVADTMDLWIETERVKLDEVISRVDALVLNDSEARMLTGESNLVRAAHHILKTKEGKEVPSLVVIKKGEHGAFVVGGDFYAASPAYPLEHIVDPTGAGDAFAGGFLGYLASKGEVNEANVRHALAVGTVVASFACEGFSVNGLGNAGPAGVADRIRELADIVRS